MARSPHDRFRKNSNKRALGTVLLPIPSDIKDGNAVSFADDKLNSVTAAAVGGSAAIMEGAGEEIRKGNLPEKILSGEAQNLKDKEIIQFLGDDVEKN